jgi:hypothetical protein
LQGTFYTVEDAYVYPVTKAAVDGISFAEMFGQGTPSTTVFGDVVQGLKKNGDRLFLRCHAASETNVGYCLCVLVSIP